MKRNLVSVAIVAAMALLVSACATQPASSPAAPASPAAESPAPAQQPAQPAPAAPAASKDPIRLGAVLTLSGPAASVGVSVQRGMDIALAEINAAGGVDGRPLEVVYKDDEGKPPVAASQATQLIQKDQVAAIVGAAITVTTVSAAQVAKQHQVVLLSPTFTGDGLTPPASDNRYVFRIGLPDRHSVKVLTSYGSQKYGKVGVLGDTGPAGQSVAAIVEQEMAALGKAPVGKEFFNMGATDVTPQLLKLKQAGAEAVIAQAVPGDTFAIARGMKQIGLDAQILGHLGFADPAFRKVVGQDSEGALAIDSYDPDNPRAAAFMQKYQAAHGNDPFYLLGALHGYDSVYILAEALKKAGGDATKLVESLESVQGFQGASGGKNATINFGANMHDGHGIDGVVLHRIQNGQLQKVQVGLGN